MQHEPLRPVVRTGAGFYADRAPRRRSDPLNQFAARSRRKHQPCPTGCVYTVDGKNMLGKTDANGNNGHDLPHSE